MSRLTNALFSSIRWTLAVVVIAYLGVCLVRGFAWTTELSPTYGLAIIRLIFAAVLAIISAVMLPFSIGDLLVAGIVNIVLLTAPLAFVARLLRTTGARLRFGPTFSASDDLEANGGLAVLNVLFFAALCVVVGNVVVDGVSGPTHIAEYLQATPLLGPAFAAVSGAWLLTNLVAPGTPTVDEPTRSLTSPTDSHDTEQEPASEDAHASALR